LAAGAELSRHGVQVQLLEAGANVGTRWRAHYDGLRLNTMRRHSHLPRQQMPRRFGRWVSRDDFVDYLERYAVQQQLSVRTKVAARRIDPLDNSTSGASWRIETQEGALDTSAVVVATGAFAEPVWPDWPGMRGYTGELRHVAEYQCPDPYIGRWVLVVGSGVSGLEVALLLSRGGAARVDVSVRSGKNIFTRELLGNPGPPIPQVDDLPTWLLDLGGKALQRMLGKDWPAPLPPPPAGIGTELRRYGREPLIVDGVVEAMRAGRIGMLPAVEGFDGSQVRLDGGMTIRPDVVIAATGFRSGLEPLVGHLGVLDDDGRPSVMDGKDHPAAPGLVFIAYQPTITGRLVQMRRQARRTAATIGRLLR
jgi:uncharacterized NAD(P)/FAD-binding protein YdhS